MEQEREIDAPPSVLLNDLQYQLSKLPEGMRSKYLLVLVVAERARQIVENPEREQTYENPIIRALNEINEGRFQPRVTDEHFLSSLQGKPEESDLFPYRT
ncbi:MAG: DNA-directed RNA polymerase subunit omega [Armatimonadetes bacterium]|nr:DNA-directed RNA polymerase subunit omega [Armatimonadota bacterium]